MSRIKLALALGAVLALTAGIGVATGAIPSSNGTINACQAKVNGFRYLRLLDTGESCHGGEKPLSWNQKGPKGDPGPAGSGALRLTLRQSSFDSSPGTESFQVACKPGEKVSGGAAFIGADSPDAAVIATSVSLDLHSYEATVRNDSGQSQNVVVEAICAA